MFSMLWELHKQAASIQEEYKPTKERAKQVALFEQTAFGYPGDNVDPFVEKVVNNEHLLTAIDGDRLVGTLRYKTKFNPYIAGLVVDPEYRGKGIGTELIKALMEKNKALDLTVMKKNMDAQRLYQRLGFQQYTAGPFKPNPVEDFLYYHWSKT